MKLDWACLLLTRLCLEGRQATSSSHASPLLSPAPSPRAALHPGPPTVISLLILPVTDNRDSVQPSLLTSLYTLHFFADPTSTSSVVPRIGSPSPFNSTHPESFHRIRKQARPLHSPHAAHQTWALVWSQLRAQLARAVGQKLAFGLPPLRRPRQQTLR